jgi:hypothetical protein
MWGLKPPTYGLTVQKLQRLSPTRPKLGSKVAALELPSKIQRPINYLFPDKTG